MHPSHARLDAGRQQFVDLLCRLFGDSQHVILMSPVCGALEHHGMSNIADFSNATKEQLTSLHCPSTPIASEWRPKFYEINRLLAINSFIQHKSFLHLAYSQANPILER